MAKANPGKQFEAQLRNGFRHHYPDAWIERFTDAVYTPGSGPRMSSVKSPPDLLVVAPEFAALIEAKAVKGTSLPFDRLAEHQGEHLRAFNDVRDDSHGMVAILRYNGLRGNARVYEGWLIPISEWDALEKNLGRKSLPLTGDMRRYLAPYYMAWVPSDGGWQVGPAMRGVSDARPSIVVLNEELPDEGLDESW